MKPRVQLFASALIFTLLLFTLACNKANDAETSNEIQQRINADSGLRNKQITVAVSNGVVTLSGTVDDITQWNAAAGYASSIKGVKQVVNNVQIAESTGVTPAQAPVQAAQQQGGSAAPKDSTPPTAAAAPAQKAERAPIPPGTPSPEVIHKKLNAFVYAANQQPPDQQQYDEMDCYNWAKSQTSIDPMGPPTPVQQVEKGENEAKGSRLKGAGRGALGGAIIGGIAGDAGKGAAIGATAGTMRGGRQVREGKKAAEEDYQQAQAQAQQQAKATDQQKISTFKKAFSVCVQGRGYSVQ
jgi:osmotically-inducible protein OsmY